MKFTKRLALLLLPFTFLAASPAQAYIRQEQDEFVVRLEMDENAQTVADNLLMTLDGLQAWNPGVDLRTISVGAFLRVPTPECLFARIKAMGPVTCMLPTPAEAETVEVKASLPKSRRDCIQALLLPIQKAAAKYKINGPVTMAQALLESGDCRSAPRFNIFGIKGKGSAGSVRFITHEVYNGRRQRITDTFAAFASYDDAIEGYGQLIERAECYRDATLVANDHVAYIKALQNGKNRYATDPRYVNSVLRIIKNADLLTLFGAQS